MRRRSSGWVLVTIVGFCACVMLCTAFAVSSACVKTFAQTPAPAPAQQQNPQQQRPADSDPVPSPDGASPSAPATPGTAPAIPAGVVTSDNGKYKLVTNAYEIRLNASVIDGSGKSVDSLPQSAFQVFEDNVPQAIVGFRHEDLPVSLGLLIDSSGSMYDKRAAVDASSLDLVKLSNPRDEEFLVDFSSEAYIDQDFTSDITKLQTGLGYIKSSGGTALYDAVIASADYLSKNGKQPKQVLLIITDGDDNASSASLEQTIRRVQDLDGPAIYCIGLLFGEDVSRSEARHSREVLTELAEQTGGEAYFPKSLREVDGIAQQVAQDIRSQYTLEYHTTNAPTNGGYRKIRVSANAKGFHNLQVRTRTGYFPHLPGATDSAPPGGK